MKVIDIINQRQGQPFASFEIVPPLKGTDAERLYNIIEPLMQLAPPFINITCHRDEVEYHPNTDGTFTKLTLSKRPSTIAIVAAVMRRFPQVQIVPHVICGGASRHHVESELLDLRFLGLHRLLDAFGKLPLRLRRFMVGVGINILHLRRALRCSSGSLGSWLPLPAVCLQIHVSLMQRFLVENRPLR